MKELTSYEPSPPHIWKEEYTETPELIEVDIKEAFESKDQIATWIYKNRKQLADIIDSNISTAIGHYIQGVAAIRPDLYFTDSVSGDKIAVFINFDNPNNEDFKKLLAISAFRDLQKTVWVVTTPPDKKTMQILYWLNEKMGFRTEFIVLKISVYQIGGFDFVPYLSRIDDPEFVDSYSLF